MSIQTYQTKEALALLDRIGWPSWYEETAKHWLEWSKRLTGWRVWFTFEQPGYSPVCETEPRDHFALCILRNHLWLYIEEKRGGTVGIEHDDDESLLAEAAALKGNDQ